MKVIVREEVELGSGNTVNVYEYNSNDDLQKLIDNDVRWFKKVHIPIEECEVDDYEAIVCGGSYSIAYYVEEVTKWNQD